MKNSCGDNKETGLFLSEDEDRELSEIVRTAMQYPPSIPGVAGCPDTETIRKIAFHEKVARKTLEKTVLHLPECGECTRIADKYIAEYRAQQAQINKYLH